MKFDWSPALDRPRRNLPPMCPLLGYLPPAGPQFQLINPAAGHCGDRRVLASMVLSLVVTLAVHFYLTD